ncbi:glycosyltransferase, partial [Candidatus Thioglobus sp.]|nr:glycosyltransferase [Candidatus Thioglobus sp.]
MLVSLIITTYNRPDALLLVLQSVERQTTIPLNIIIADDGSNNETLEIIRN